MARSAYVYLAVREDGVRAAFSVKWELVLFISRSSVRVDRVTRFRDGVPDSEIDMPELLVGYEWS